jgi:hypothetical protein
VPVQALQSDFQLHTLGWKAFQDLSLTIVSEILGQAVQKFLNSHDGGRDGAFHGEWNPQLGSGGVDGSLTIQCKFTSDPTASLSPGDLRDEFRKAARLGLRGLADNYVIISNYGVSGTADERIREQVLAFPGIKNVLVFGRDWVTQQIRESPRVRMLVPRIYGLGDLTEILDERAYSQVSEFLEALRQDLPTFVVTEAYHKSASAILNHGFVLLLGQPASGKTTIGAHLVLGAVDHWASRPIKLRHPDDFTSSRNPNEPKQFFWIDDAFGVTQYQREAANAWNRQFPAVRAAIKAGARFLLTSRDYIYRAASNDLKTEAFPLLTDSQVVIDVQQLTESERDQILYNHIKYGDQPKEFRQAIKLFLKAIARSPHFLPEIARRLGNRQFTRDLAMSAPGLTEFTERPVSFLADIVRSLDVASKAALSIIFMNGGNLSRPVELDEEQERVLRTLGGSVGGLRVALVSLEGSLVRKSGSLDAPTWSFRHPTIGESVASLVRHDPELLDVYLGGANIDRLLEEVTCGDVGIEGVRVVIPSSRYTTFIKRLKDVKDPNRMRYFLAQRCDRGFLALAMPAFPDLPNIETTFDAKYIWEPFVALLAKLGALGLLAEEHRQAFVRTAGSRTVDWPDGDVFSVPAARALLTDGELRAIRNRVRVEVIPVLDDLIDSARADWVTTSDGMRADPESHFGSLRTVVQVFREEFGEDEEALTSLQNAWDQIKYVITELESEDTGDDYGSHDDPFDDEVSHGHTAEDRSIFDDIDQ